MGRKEKEKWRKREGRGGGEGEREGGREREGERGRERGRVREYCSITPVMKCLYFIHIIYMYMFMYNVQN